MAWATLMYRFKNYQCVIIKAFSSLFIWYQCLERTLVTPHVSYGDGTVLYQTISDWWSDLEDIYTMYISHISINPSDANVGRTNVKTMDVRAFATKGTLSQAARAWSSYQIRKIVCCACVGNAGNVFPAIDFKETVS